MTSQDITIKYGIRGKILTLVGLLIGLMLVLGLSTSFMLSKIGKELQLVAHQDIPLTQTATKVIETQLLQSMELQKALRYGELSDTEPGYSDKYNDATNAFKKYAKKVDNKVIEIEQRLETAARKTHSTETRQKFEQLLAKVKQIAKGQHEFNKISSSIFNHINNGDFYSAVSLMTNLEATEAKLNQDVEVLLTEISEFTEKSLLIVEQHEQESIVIIWVILITSLIFGSTVGFLIARKIVTELNKAVSLSEAIANGEFNNEVKIATRDEAGKLLAALDKMQQDLQASTEIDLQMRRQVEAIGRSQAVIEFNMDGTIINANDNFLNAMGYDIDEIKGKHHSMFVGGSYKDSAAYQQFWSELNEGVFQAGEYKRFAKGGREIWIQASYNPILDLNEKPIKVVKCATDVTEQKLKNADFSGQIDAIGKSQAVIEFNMDGTILNANENFLNAVGYSLSEIKGKHHSMFASSELAASAEYKEFWKQLNNGVYQAGEYERFGKGGRQIWIQASYNPILDLNQKPFKVVKYATDITAKKQGVAEISEVLLKLSDGNLKTRIKNKLPGELEDVRLAVNKTLDNLSSLVRNIADASSSLNTSVNEIAQGNMSLQARTEEQAANLEETAASMEQMAAGVKENSDNSNQAETLSKEAQSKAEQGGGVVLDVVNAMQEINDSSNKIGEIIVVIDEITFQTNLLALNAAVEAARAGEQGKGFAVVASEVRSLAQRSAGSAKEIKDLIKDSSLKVELGTKLAKTSGESLTEIVESVKKVYESISMISESCKEQSSGVQQINMAVSNLDNMTQQNSALVEEITAATGEMQTQSKELLKQLSSFDW